MGEIQWAMWANEQAVLSSAILFIGAIIGVAGQFKFWECAAFCIVSSILVFLLEYPRGKRNKGHTIERRYQHILTPVVNKLSPVTTNYFVRFFMHILLSVPCCFLLPTILGGICLIIAAIIYLIAAVKGESWLPVGLDKKDTPTEGPKGVTSNPPEHPPPRLPKKDAKMETNSNGDNRI